MSFVDQSLSLFIPRVFPNITQERIADIFYALGLGNVKRVDRVLKQDANGNEYYSVYVHFDQWYETLSVARFQERVTNPDKEARIVYDDPWWWIVLENKGTKRTPGDRKSTLVLDEPAKKSVSFAQAPAFDPTVEESCDLVDAIYTEYYETQLMLERAKVEHLENELWNTQQSFNAVREANIFLNKEVQDLQEEVQDLRRWLGRATHLSHDKEIDIESGVNTALFV
jgi:hypothetical protein